MINDENEIFKKAWFKMKEDCKYCVSPNVGYRMNTILKELNFPSNEIDYRFAWLTLHEHYKCISNICIMLHMNHIMQHIHNENKKQQE